jgi:hypothetical protein
MQKRAVARKSDPDVLIMKKSLLNAKMKVNCPKCTREVSGWVTQFKAISGKIMKHIKTSHHKCELPKKVDYKFIL